jgi:hypothetical protein
LFHAKIVLLAGANPVPFPKQCRELILGSSGGAWNSPRHDNSIDPRSALFTIFFCTVVYGINAVSS